MYWGLRLLNPKKLSLTTAWCFRGQSINKDTGKKQEWACTIHAQPSIFQPDTDAVYLASACNELAISARRKSLKPGDRVVVKGVVASQTIAFPNGETQTVNRIALTKAPHMLTKEKRISTTIFEQRQHW